MALFHKLNNNSPSLEQYLDKFLFRNSVSSVKLQYFSLACFMVSICLCSKINRIVTPWVFVLKDSTKFHLLVSTETIFSSFFKFKNIAFFSKTGGGAAGDLISKSVCFDSA